MPSEQHGMFHHICIWRGFALAGLFTTWGIWCVANHTSYFFGRGVGIIQLSGWPAVALGIAWIGAGFALHNEYFWRRIDVEPIWRFGYVGVFLGVALMVIGCIGMLVTMTQPIIPP